MYSNVKNVMGVEITNAKSFAVTDFESLTFLKEMVTTKVILRNYV